MRITTFFKKILKLIGTIVESGKDRDPGAAKEEKPSMRSVRQKGGRKARKER